MLDGAVLTTLAGAAAVGFLGVNNEQPSREAIIEAGRDIMVAAAQCALVTIGPDGAPQARIMDPFPPEDDLTVWMATHRDTRKVAEMRAEDRVTLIYYDRDNPGYAALVGRVRLVDAIDERRARWKDAWSEFYPGGPENESYLLIEFVPDRLEVVSVQHDIAADPQAWRAAVVRFDRR